MNIYIEWRSGEINIKEPILSIATFDLGLGVCVVSLFRTFSTSFCSPSLCSALSTGLVRLLPEFLSVFGQCAHGIKGKFVKWLKC